MPSIRNVASSPRFKLSIGIVVLGVFCAACSETTLDDLEIRNGITYEKNSRTPFSGSVKAYYKNSDGKSPDGKESSSKNSEGTRGKLYKECSYVAGKPDGDWITYKWGGEKELVKYVNGKKDGVSSTFYANGNLKSEQTFVDGKLHGPSMQLALSGQPTEQSYYRHGVKGSPPLDAKVEKEEEDKKALLAKERNEKLSGKQTKTWYDLLLEMLWKPSAKPHSSKELDSKKEKPHSDKELKTKKE